MASYIDRETAIDRLEKIFRYTDHDEPVVDWNDLVTTLCFLPTTNVREVILCEDCKWWKRHSPSFGDCHNPRWGDGHGLYAPPITGEEAFCRYAERRINDD